MATPGSSSAATFVAALLEHQGYVTQARFLDAFKDFFEMGGGLVYLLAGAGAIFSIVSFGSFRAARYLLIGPALFWFLVGPRADNVKGAIWQLGGGSPKAARAAASGEQAAASSRDEILAKLDSNGQGPNSNIQIAQGFWLFAKPINDFTNEMVNFLLKDEDKSDLLVFSRVYGLETIANSLPQDGEYIQRTEQGFLLGCSHMVGAATAAASVMVKQKGQGAFRGTTGNNTAHQDLINHHLERMREFAKETINTRGTGFDSLIRSQNQRGGGSALARSLLQANGEPSPTMSCRQAWQLIAEETWHRAGLGLNRIMTIATLGFGGQPADTAEAVCSELTSKAVKEGNGECNLRPAIALALLNKRMTQPYLFNQLMMRHWNDAAHKNPEPQVLLVPGLEGGFSASTFNGETLMKMATANLGRVITKLNVFKTRKRPDGNMERTSFWAPALQLNMDYGMNHAMWVSTRQHEVARLRQQIFAYALNLPYYQGVLLFVLAVSYPFFAMIVLVPGKAVAALNLPLAWLWAKSWDIGFAGVIILDKVMYNLLPSRNIHPNLERGPWQSIEQMPMAFAEAFNFDPMGSIHNYYSMLSFVMLSIPTITGYATLRAKRGMLAAFSDAAEETARNSGDRAADSFSEAAQSKRNAMMREMGGFAAKLPTMGALEGEGAAAGVARMFASAAGMAKGLNSGEIGKLATAVSNEDRRALLSATGKESIDRVEQGLLAYNTVYKDVLSSMMRLQSATLQAFDPVLGSMSVTGMLHGAYLAAMDGGGGYELYEHFTSFADKYIDSVNTRLKVSMNAIADAQGVIIKTGQSMALTETGGNAKLAELGVLLSAGMVGRFANVENGLSVFDGLRRAYGMGGNTAEEWRAVALNMHPSINSTGFKDPQNANQGFMDMYFGVTREQPLPLPGGSSSFVNSILATSGGTRTTEVIENGKASVVPDGFRSLPGMSAVGGAFDAVKEKVSPYIPNISLPFWQGPVDVFNHHIKAEEAWQRARPVEYDSHVKERAAALTQYYGQETIATYFKSLGQSEADANDITVGDLYQYAKHIESEQHLQGPFKIDSRVGEHVKAHPIAVLEELEDWQDRRGQGLRGQRLGIRPDAGFQIVTEPKHLWSKPEK